VQVKAVYDGPIPAPVTAGQPIGELVMQIPGMPEFRAPLVAASDVPQLGFGGRVVAMLQQMIFGAEQPQPQPQQN
jgi:D-alanyl-D-alanine carboxypeptidase (penicillin-binding protein 5/6)